MRYLSFLLLSLLLVSCTGSGDPAVTDTTETRDTTKNADSTIMPLAVGNVWVGRTMAYDTAGMVVGGSFSDTIRLLSTVTNGGHVWYLDQTGNRYCLDARGLLGSANVWIAIHPAHREDTFSTVSAMVVDSSGKLVQGRAGWQVVSTDTVITVPAGTFHCYHYRSAIISPPDGILLQQISLFFAPGVGQVVKEFRRRGAPTPDMRWELVSYHLL